MSHLCHVAVAVKQASAALDTSRDRLAQAQRVVVTELGILRKQLAGASPGPTPTTRAVPAGAQAPTGAGGSAFTRAVKPPALPSLLSLGLIHYPTPKNVVALPVLFLEGRA